MSERKQININLEQEGELFELLNAYRKSLGLTWKRFLIVGFAETLAQNDENPQLLALCVDYLSGKR